MRETCVTSWFSIGSKGSRIGGMLVIDSAPSVVPWYAVSRAITFIRSGSPFARKY